MSMTLDEIVDCLEMVFLTPGESRVFKLLQSKAPQIVTYREIYEVFSHPTTMFQPSTVQRLVSHIRCKMHTDHIKNVMTIGYYWDEDA